MVGSRSRGVLVAAVAAGVVLGVTCARWVWVGSGASLAPWAVAALALGAAASGRGTAVLASALYGFVLSVSFMVAGYDGHASMWARTWFFTLLGVVGACCAAALGALGHAVATALRRRDTS